jgi:hypothetical protein
MEEWERLADYFHKFIKPEVERIFQVGTKKYGAAYKSKRVTKGRTAVEDVHHIRELHVDVRLREAEESLDNGDLQRALEKIESAIGYLVILHMRTRERRPQFEKPEGDPNGTK